VKRLLAVLTLTVVLASSAPPARAEITDQWERMILNALCAQNRCHAPDDPVLKGWLERLDPLVQPIRAEAGLDHSHIMEATLTDSAGRVFPVRLLRFPDRLAPSGQARVRLVFEPVPAPPATSTAVLTIPDLWIGDQAYEIKVELRF